MTEPKHTFVVDRRTWARAGRGGSTLLQNSYGNRCCLGFVCLQLGVPEDAIRVRSSPCDVQPKHWHRLAGVLVMDDVDATEVEEGDVELAATWLTLSAIEINDDDTIDDAERERRLSAVFAEHGCAMRFEG